MKLALMGLVLAAALGSATNAQAWGAEGHRIVGYVADAELTAPAQAAVRKIMKADSLSSVATWMDDVRGTAQGEAMKPWHFVDTEVCSPTEVPCLGGNCAIEKIRWARDTLKTAKGAAALKALRVLVHLVGDIHQPLHASDNHDFGGNGDQVANVMCKEYGSTQLTPCKLHTYWDSNLVVIAAAGKSETAAATAWASALGKLPKNDSDNSSDWAFESLADAKKTAYNFPGFACGKTKLSFTATAEYEKAGAEEVARRIATAGKRLARVLNGVFQ